MQNHVKILCICDYFLPGFLGGGPVTTLANMRRQLSEQVTLSIFTRDRDLGASAQYSNIIVNRWIETSDGPIYYASPIFFGSIGVIKAFNNKNFDLIYLNSFFSLKASILPLLSLLKLKPEIPIILAPRGEFSDAALSIKSLKKKAYLKIVKHFDLYRDIYWHASTKIEAEDIKRIFPKSKDRILVAADPVLSEPYHPASPRLKKECGRLRMVFVSRISPIKNLDGLIKILTTVSLPVHLDIFGPIEDEIYWNYCTKLIENLPLHIQVVFRGILSPDSVSSAFHKYELFAFPTRGENFGHVVFESLRAGTPVLVSDQTPWVNDDDGAVSVIPLHDTTGWRKAIEKAALSTVEEHDRLRNTAQRYAIRYAKEADTKRANLDIFSKVLSHKIFR